MLTSFSEFKFYQSFRVPVEKADNLRFLVEQDDEFGKPIYIDDATLVDISVTGLGFSTMERISVGTELTISLQFKKYHLDLQGKVVRAFCNMLEDDEIIYGIEIDEEKSIHKFLESYILSFSSERLKDCLINSALKEKYTKASDGFEMFSLLLSLFKDITHFGDKEGFLDSMMEEVVRILNAQRASIFLINPDTNELEAVAALGIDKEQLRFDYRVGIAGSVFTTGVALNIDNNSDSSRFNNFFDKKFNFTSQSIICHPIHNREDKIIGVIEVINKRSEHRFTVEDEKTMKVLALVFSSVFHGYNPISESTQIRRFSIPRDRDFALIGKTQHMGSLRNSIIKIKDLESTVLIQGEQGVGKSLYAKILHHEGQRGLKSFEAIDCKSKDFETLGQKLWGPNEAICEFTKCQGGTVLLSEISKLSLEFQAKLYDSLLKGGVNSGTISFDARIIATSSDDLGKMVDEGTFHAGLHEYISRAYIYIEPLRRRPDDISQLVDYFLKAECKSQGLLLKSFSPKTMKKIVEYDWPRNVHELKTCVQRAVLYNPKTHILTDIGFEDSATPLVDHAVKSRMFGGHPHVANHKASLKDRVAVIEREMILAEIKRNNGNKSLAAKEMGISREALRKKLIVSQQVLEMFNAKESSEDKDAA